MAYSVHQGRIKRAPSRHEKQIASAIPRTDYTQLAQANATGTRTMSDANGPTDGTQEAQRAALTKRLNELFAEIHKGLYAGFLEAHKARDVTDHPQYQIIYASALVQLAAMLLVDCGFDPSRFHQICLESYQRAYDQAPKFG